MHHAGAGHHAPTLDEIKETLWATADKRRANMDAAELLQLLALIGTAAHGDWP